MSVFFFTIDNTLFYLPHPNHLHLFSINSVLKTSNNLASATILIFNQFLKLKYDLFFVSVLQVVALQLLDIPTELHLALHVLYLKLHLITSTPGSVHFQHDVLLP